ncbi:MAG: TonB-dependent receptor [Prevotellaceae bacterium]|jgi:TonB-linked SusC/RagA family outer membrane protein|nr:TonB-dependent receptor [Prevotellaceae bacterium]
MNKKLLDRSRTERAMLAPVHAAYAGKARRKNRPLLLLLLSLLLFCAALPLPLRAQDLNISGTVLDGKGDPVAGASVVVKGSTAGTVTGANGSYDVSAPANATLVFSFLGLAAKEEAVAGRSRIDVTLSESSRDIDEVVVVGYGVQRKSSVTGAISQVKAEDIKGRSITRVEQALQGKTSGVQLITASAQPGSTPTIRVRGFSSNGTSDPLYVVDGLRVSDIGAIDPNNIATIEVLKDAASAAIYGAEAGNGVVLISTKTGKAGETSISYEYQLAVNNLAQRPRLITSREALDMSKEASPSFTNEDIRNLITSGVWNGRSTTDWYDVAFEPSLTHKHAVNFQGGNDRGSFFLSLNFLDDDGIIRGNKDSYKRIAPMLNADYNIKPWLKIGTTNSFEKWERRAIMDGGGQTNTYTSMISRVMTLNPYFASTYSPDALPTAMQNQLNAGWTLLQDENENYYMTLGAGEQVHPLVSRDAADSKNYGANLLGTMFMDLKPLPGLVFTSKLGYRISTANAYTFMHDYYGATSVGNKANSANRNTISTSYYQWENFLNYSVLLAEAHNVNVMAGMAFSENDLTYVSGGIDKVMKDDPLFADVSYPAGDANKSAGGYNTVNRKLSYFGRMSYDYKNKYLVQASLRADAADLSVLPKEGRWGYFPAVSAGWTLSNESFFSQQKIVDFAKIRFSWGQNGSTSNLGNYLYSSAIANDGVGYSYAADQLIYHIASSPAQMSNPELKWETSEQVDLGVDLRFLNNRLSFAFDWFDKKTKDLIVMGSSLPYEAGNSAPPINAGNVSNKGVEIELGWKGSAGDFSYGVNANFSYLKNEVTYLEPSLSNGRIIGSASVHLGGGISAFEVGKPVWYFWGYKVDHLDDNGNPVLVDVDKNGTYDNADKMELGKPMPDVTYGITLNAAWKGLDLLVFGTGASGNSIFSAMGYGTITYNLKEIYDQRWTADNKTAKYARAGALNSDIYRYSDAYVFDGSYFKIKQIQVGYTFPKSWSRKALIDQLRVYASMDDWFIFTPYPELDPEVAANATSGMGVDYGNYPNTRKLVFGINITF